MAPLIYVLPRAPDILKTALTVFNPTFHAFFFSPPIVTRIGGTIEMDCSAIYATEYPILWVKLPSQCKVARESLADNIRSIVSDSCTPIPLSSGSALIIRDNRFRCLISISNLRVI